LVVVIIIISIAAIVHRYTDAFFVDEHSSSWHILGRQNVTLPAVLADHLEWDRYTKEEIKARVQILQAFTVTTRFCLDREISFVATESLFRASSLSLVSSPKTPNLSLRTFQFPNVFSSLLQLVCVF
jgi:hypothetical protein